jgi:short-subunit dehydrogenase
MKTNIMLVTGCSTGIGRALAEEFHRRGHVVYATARRVSTLSALEARGIRTATLDVTDGESIRRLQARLQHDGVIVALLINVDRTGEDLCWCDRGNGAIIRSP